MSKVVVCTNLKGKFHLTPFFLTLSNIVICLIIITSPWVYYYFSHPYNYYYVLSSYSRLVVGYHLGRSMIAQNVHPLTEWDWRTKMKLGLLQTSLETTLSNGFSPSLWILHWWNLQCYQHEAREFL
jgi:hypothetical protein